MVFLIMDSLFRAPRTTSFALAATVVLLVYIVEGASGQRLVHVSMLDVYWPHVPLVSSSSCMYALYVHTSGVSEWQNLNT